MRKHAAFLAVLAFAAVTRFCMLFYSQTHVHSDEAVIGLMAKHILELSSHPFYMFGQFYNAGAAWEAYLGAVSFYLFGVGVVPLKGCIVVMSLAWLWCFYRMVCELYGVRTAALAALIFALSPSLFKWNFQVRGYSWYFLSLPLLTCLFLSVERAPSPRRRRTFLFGLASGLSILNLELGLTLVLALWLLLGLRRKLGARNGWAGAAGFLAGYSPAIIFNLMHHFVNWRFVFTSKTNGSVTAALFHPGTLASIFFQEMPKFFGPDTVLWYYPEVPPLGWIMYGVVIVAVGSALGPFLRAPATAIECLRGRTVDTPEARDFLMLVLSASCFVPYLAAPTRVPSYFLGGCFFLSPLVARLVERALSASRGTLRLLGATTVMAVVIAGGTAMIQTGVRNQIETLTVDRTGTQFHLTRIPGQDLEAVERCLAQSGTKSLWATISFVCPLTFESHETLDVSCAIFGWDYTPPTDKHRPKADASKRTAFVVETDSPLLADAKARCARKTGVAPIVTDCGILSVVQETAQIKPVPKP